MKVKLAIGVPTADQIKTPTVLSLFRAVRQLPCEYQMIFKQGGGIHINREEIVKAAIQIQCTHLLFVDSDMFFEADAVNRLLAREKDIVGVHYYTKSLSLPRETTVQMSQEKKSKLRENHPDGFLTCEGVATGFLLTSLDVFKKLSRPWFFWKLNKEGETIQGEDYWFCEKARAAGFEIWVDLTISVKHIGDYMY